MKNPQTRKKTKGTQKDEKILSRFDREHQKRNVLGKRAEAQAETYCDQNRNEKKKKNQKMKANQRKTVCEGARTGSNHPQDKISSSKKHLEWGKKWL